MSKRIPLAVGLLVLTLAACQPATGVGTSISKVPRKTPPRVAQPAASAPGAVTQPGQASPQPSPSATSPAPQPTPATGASSTPSAGPTIFRPSKEPDAVPSGYVSPLPSSFFPSPSPEPSSAVSVAPSPPPSPAPIPSVLDAVVVSNSLPYGSGELTGYVVEPIAGQVDQYRPVPNVTVSIVSDDDTTKKALLTNATNGTYRLPEVALGAYKVRVEKSGYAADSAPTTVRIYPGYQSGHTVFLIVPQQ